ncbi:MAG TPA: DUF4350 domain-containing protein, partial [Candidatus Acidoferrales bacterium]|nr:DUF4350 domain-containing protein [Candidatus Acidoferrales bacterium]
MSGRSIEVLALAAAVVAVAGLAYDAQVVNAPPPPSVPSTYDTGPNGYRAFYETLRAAGVPVRRFERALPTLERGVATLVISGYEFEPRAEPLDAADVSWLRAFVRGGGRLVEIDRSMAGADDIAPNVGVTSAAPAGTRGATPI